MGLTVPQTITLLQTGDIVEGYLNLSSLNTLQADFHIGAGLDNWLDAVNGSYCMLGGGNAPGLVR